MNMRIFDYGFLKEARLPATMFGKAHMIGSYMESIAGRMREKPDVFEKLRHHAEFLSVKGSNAIEGISTSDERLTSLMNRDIEPAGHFEEEIAGYRDVLQSIHSNHKDMDLSVDLILDMHKTLMGYTVNGGGQYKTSDNVIIHIDEDGTRRVHFRPLSAKETPYAMEQSVLAYIDAYQNGVEPLLLIPCFILDFLSIHPFTDGNGRMSRLLTLLLLYKSGYDVGRYISFEERIDFTRKDYYRSLAFSSKDWHDGSNDYVPFMEYYLDVLFMCYRGLDRCFMTIDSKKVTKTNRIEAVIMGSIVPISKKEIMSMLPDVSQTTVEACLHRMMTEGRIEKIGGNRNARYRRA